MTDIALRWNPNTQTADLVLDGPGLLADDGLETRVIISLFSDARARPDDPLPGTDGRRGWWGDAVPPTVLGETMTGHRTGSRLWLLWREKQVPEVLLRAREYAREALAWMIADRIATRIDVAAEFPRAEWLAIGVTIWRPDGAAVDYRYELSWQAQARRAA